MAKIKKTVIFMGYSCNNNCLFCFNSEKRNKIKDESAAAIKKKIFQAKKDGTTYLELIGGEPTIRRDIIGIVKYAKNLGFETIMFATNGRMFSNEKFAEKIIGAGVNHVVFSIHGHNAELHDSLTKVPGSFSQLLKGIRNLKKIGFSAIGSNTTIVKQNYRSLPEIGKLIFSLGIRNSEFIFVDPTRGAPRKKFSEIVPSYEEVSPYVNMLLDFGMKNKAMHWHVRYYPLCFIDEKHHEMVSEQLEKEIFETAHVAPDFRNMDVSKSREAVGRVKIKRCKGCAYSEKCEGYWKVYADKIKGNSSEISIDDEIAKINFLKCARYKINSIGNNILLRLNKNNNSYFIKLFRKKGYINKINSVLSRIPEKNKPPFPKIVESSLNDGTMQCDYLVMEEINGKKMNVAWQKLSLKDKKDILDSLACNLAIFHKANICSKEEMSMQAWKNDFMENLRIALKKLEKRQLSKNLLNKLDNWFSRAVQKWQSELKFSMIHNDLRFGNLLVKNEKGKCRISGILDFECVIKGPILFDLARLAVSLQEKELFGFFASMYAEYASCNPSLCSVQGAEEYILFHLIKVLNQVVVNDKKILENELALFIEGKKDLFSLIKDLNSRFNFLHSKM